MLYYVIIGLLNCRNRELKREALGCFRNKDFFEISFEIFYFEVGVEAAACYYPEPNCLKNIDFLLI